jgi:hypothetical protein
MERNELYKYLQLPDDYWIITTNMDIEFQYEQEDESK